MYRVAPLNAGANYIARSPCFNKREDAEAFAKVWNGENPAHPVVVWQVVKA